MAVERIRIKKVLTHDFAVDDEVQNFDGIIKHLLKSLPKFLQFDYNNQSNFKAKSITNLIINVK